MMEVESSSAPSAERCGPQWLASHTTATRMLHGYLHLHPDPDRAPVLKKAMRCVYNALIRTHHITSRKKVAKLKQAATFHDVFVLQRSGGAPGVMYVEGKEDGVSQWVNDVQNLRYKDYQLVSRTAAVHRENTPDAEHMKRAGLFESDTVKDFGSQMQQRGVYAWWREAMGFTGSYDKI